MHIADAKIDLNGRALAIGAIKFPPSDDNIFIAPDAENLVIGFEQDMCRIQAVEVRRDSDTGFILSESIGPHVMLPTAISQFLRGALTYSRSEPVTASVNNHTGFLRLGDARECWDQGLSNWRIAAERQHGSLVVQITANLHDDTPVDEKWLYRSPPTQYWAVQTATHDQLQINFTVDLMTRTLMFGALEPENRSDKLTTLIEQPSHNSPISLQNTMITLLGDLVCIGDRQPFVEVSRRNKYSEIVIRKLNGAQYDEFGFFSYGQENDPRVILTCVSLDQVSKTLVDTESFSIKFEGGDFGEVAPVSAHRWDYDYDVKPDRRIRQADLRFLLNENGLRFEYDLYCPTCSSEGGRQGWYQDALTIPWEALIIHYPKIGSKWKQYKK